MDGDIRDDVFDGAGDAVERIVLKFDACPGANGVGAANFVEEVVVDVVAAGGAIEAIGLVTGCVAAGLVADWKSSKSSSSIAVLPCTAPKSPRALETAGALLLEVDGAGSSPKSNRSCSGAFGLGGSRLGGADGVVLEVVVLAGLTISSSSASSYSSN